MGKYTNIDDPSAFFQTAIWTGNATSRTIDLDSNSTMQPDFSWVKSRSNAYENYLQNSSSGTDKYLRSNRTSSEQNGTVVTYNSTGFGIGSGAENNENGTTNVGWFWKANNGTTSSNTDGSITSTVQANQDAGFSIVTWTGNTTGSSQTIGHGLGSAPKTIIVKDRDSTSVWVSYHEPLGTGKYMQLNSEAAQGSISNYWSSTAPSSTVFGVIGDNGGVGYANNVSGNNMIAYCFAEKQGYSKFSSYTGNGNADGAFVYTGFKPAWVMVKNATDSGVSWMIQDHKRDIDNPVHHRLKANDLAAEGDNVNYYDFLSNGFKARINDSSFNLSGKTYIYMAFAENPFVTSTGIMGTAR